MQKKVSIICCYTSEQQLSYLADSLESQTLEHEQIFIDNSQNAFTSCASALNYGAKKSTGDLLLFAHQDIKFKSQDALERLVDACGVLQSGDVGGVAGAIPRGRKNILKTNITHGYQQESYFESAFFSEPYIPVDTIDECVIILPRQTWEKHQFDEVLCDNWHGYGVEQSLYARMNGHNVYVFDADINHLSSKGTFRKPFFDSIRKLVKAYGTTFPQIVATTGFWPAKGLELAFIEARIKQRVVPIVQKFES